MQLSRFHPVIERWFANRFAEPTEPQRRAWPVIQQGGDVLIAAPTGSGKTFAAFLSAIRSEEHTSELQSRLHLVCRLLLEKKKIQSKQQNLIIFNHKPSSNN